MKPVYLDYNATTPIDPQVLEVMLPYFSTHFGNASSRAHALGWAAEEAVSQAREQVATLIGAEPKEIVFTGGATEAINLAIKGVATAYASKGRHLITVQTEHKAVLDTCKALEALGYTVTYLPVDEAGRVTPEAVAEAITPETVLLSVMWANNEVGTLQPIEALSRVARAHDVLFMTDATQAVGKIPVDVSGVDLLACSAHKFYGPKGVGALYVSRKRPRVRLWPLIHGGGQENNMRGGTLNTPGIVGMGAAAEKAGTLLDQDMKQTAALRDRLEQGFLERLPDVVVNGSRTDRLPQTTNLTFRGVKASALMGAVRDVAVSAGSACTSGSGKPSHVLKAMGLSDAEAFASIRFGVGRFTTGDEVDYAVENMASAVRRLRAEAPVLET